MIKEGFPLKDAEQEIKTIEEKSAILRSELRELASIDNALDNYKQELRRPIHV